MNQNQNKAEGFRQEIRTLIQLLPGDGSDTELAEALSGEWHILHLHVSAVWVPEQRNLDGSIERGHMHRERIVTLMRTLTVPEDAPTLSIPVPASVPTSPIWIGIDDPDDDESDEPEEDIDEPEEDIDEPEEDIDEPEEDIDEPEKDIDEPEEDIDEPEEDIDEPEEDIDERKPDEVLRGVVMTAQEATEAQAMALRPDPEDVTFSFAVRSGLYSAEEIKAIGNREAREAGLRAALEVQQRQEGNRVTFGWQFRLPQVVEIER
jgi:hypothetical protein